MNRSGVVMFLVAIVVPAWALGEDFEPEFANAKLHGPGGVEYRLVRVDRDVRNKSFDERFVVEGAVVRERTGRDGKAPREIASSDGRNLRPLASTGKLAFFAVENTDEERNGRILHLRAEIRRLDLESFVWLPSWSVAQATAQPAEDGPSAARGGPARLGTLLAKDGRVFLLTYDWPWGIFGKPVGYRITCFDPDAPRPRWSKPFTWEGGGFAAPAMYDSHVLGANDDWLDPLTWMRDVADEGAVMVCAGHKQDLVCLAANDGAECWRIPKVWEYERGYIGPSVGEYFVSRFGIDYHTVDVAQEGECESNGTEHRKAHNLVEDARTKFEQTYEGMMAAGPIVVPAEGDVGGPIFIATARRRNSRLGAGHEQPSQCTVYEIATDSGDILASVTLPRMVDGRPLRASPGAIIWPCEQGSLARLHEYSPGPFGDALCSVAWYREYSMRMPLCWFSAAPYRGVFVLSANRLYRPAAAYIEKYEEPLYHFVVNVVDLQTGVDHDLMLAIPYQGDFPLPETNYSSMPGYTHSSQPHLLGIANIAVEGKKLRVTMGHRFSNAQPVVLEFELPDR